MRNLTVCILALALGGCVAKTALDTAVSAARLPVKIASSTVDAVTVSQAEADQKLGRQVRKHEECMGKEARRADKEGREPDYRRCPAPGK
jgi:hypothetical protein